MRHTYWKPWYLFGLAELKFCYLLFLFGDPDTCLEYLILIWMLETYLLDTSCFSLKIRILVWLARDYLFGILVTDLKLETYRLVNALLCLVLAELKFCWLLFLFCNLMFCFVVSCFSLKIRILVCLARDYLFGILYTLFESLLLTTWYFNYFFGSSRSSV